MQYAVIAYAAGIVTAILGYLAVSSIPVKNILSERAVDPKQPLRHWPKSVEPSE